MFAFLKRLLGRAMAASPPESGPLPAAVAGQRPAETSLRQGEEHFLNLVAGVTDYAIFLLDPAGNVQTWNAGAERLKGYRADEIIGQHFSKFYPKDAVASGWPAYELQEAAQEGRFEDEGWRIRKDGTRFWANVIITALKDETGHLRGFLKITRDLTVRKHAEAKLRLSEQRFRLVVEGVQDYAIFMLDPQGTIVTWNAGAKRLMGYDSEEIIGQHFSRLVPPEEVTTGKPARELEIAASAGKYEDEGWRIRKDGSRFWASMVLTTIRNKEGHLRGFVKVNRDLTQRKRDEEALQQSEERFRLLVEGVKDYAIFMLDPDGRVATWNAGAERIKGWKAEEIIGQHFSTFYPPEALERGWPEHELKVAAQVGRFEDEGWRLRKDGSRFWANVVITALRDRGGRLVGFGKVTRDLTERKQAEERLRAANDELQEQVRLRTAELEREQQRLRVTLSSIGDAVIAVDAQSRITFLNPVARHLTGWTTEEAVGQPLESVFHIINEESRQPIEHPVARVLREGVVAGLANHTVLVARDGTERPIDDTAAPIQGEAGRTEGVVLVFRDATEQRQAERLQANLQAELERQVRDRTAELRASEERFRLLVEGTTDYAIFLLDPTGHVSSWNPGAERLKGYQAEEIIGQHFTRFYPQEALNRGWPAHELKVAAQVGRFEDEGWRLRKDGSRFWANVIITALKDDAGNLRGFSKITRDLSQRRQAEEDARRLAAEQAARQAAEAQAEVIRSQREQLRITLESIGDAVVATDAHGGVTLLNPVAQTLTGWTLDEARGQSHERVLDLKNEQTGRPADSPVDRALREGVVVGLANHTVLRSKDGSQRPIEDSAAPIKDGRGSIQGCVMVFHDVSEKKQAERALRESEQRYRAFVSASSDVVYRMSADWTEMRHLQGREFLADTHEPSGSWLQTYIHPDDQPHVLAAIQEAVRTKSVFELEHRVVRVDGTLGWTFSRAVPLLDESGEVVEWFGAASDVTARKRAEEELQKERDRLQVTLASIGDAVITTDAESRVTFLNGVAEELTGWPNAEVTGRPLDAVFRIVNEKTRTGAENPALRALREGVVVGLANHTVLIRKDGTERPIDDTAAPIKDEQGGVVGCVLVFRDVTERRRAEEAMREADRRKDEFLATLAHELRNPLAPLRNGLHTLCLAGDDRRVWEQVRPMMERQLGHMVRLVDDLLDLSRISRGKIELRRERVDVASVVNNAVETSRPLIEASHHQLEVTLPEQPVYLDADATRLAQVLSNLLNNAARYTPEEGRVRLSVEARPGEVAFRVTDSGIGIPAEKLPQVFDMFTQAEPAKERSRGGLGIGLTLVKRLVEMHAGTVEASSAGPGLGSEFLVRLPVPAGEPLRQAAPPPATLHPGNDLFRVLIVDDNQDSAESLAMLLRMLGHDTRTAYDGAEGLKILEAYQPEVVLLDIGMPNMNGYEVARRIREQERLQGVLLCAMTGWGQDEDRRKSREAGFDHHLVKPLDLAALQPVFEAAKRSSGPKAD